MFVVQPRRGCAPRSGRATVLSRRRRRHRSAPGRRPSCGSGHRAPCLSTRATLLPVLLPWLRPGACGTCSPRPSLRSWGRTPRRPGSSRPRSARWTTAPLGRTPCGPLFKTHVPRPCVAGTPRRLQRAPGTWPRPLGGAPMNGRRGPALGAFVTDLRSRLARVRWIFARSNPFRAGDGRTQQDRSLTRVSAGHL